MEFSHKKGGNYHHHISTHYSAYITVTWYKRNNLAGYCFANRLAVNTLDSDIAKIIPFLNLVIFSRGISREKVFRSQIKSSHVSLLEGSQTLFSL
jgi:hypothetical protein